MRCYRTNPERRHPRTLIETSDETPNLYTLILSAAGQVITTKVGFRTVEVRDGLLQVNGVAVTLKGVNRHEHDPDTGRVVTEASMLQDIRAGRPSEIDALCGAVSALGARHGVATPVNTALSQLIHALEADPPGVASVAGDAAREALLHSRPSS